MNLNELGGEPLALCAAREISFSSPVARLPGEELESIVQPVGLLFFFRYCVEAFAQGI